MSDIESTEPHMEDEPETPQRPPKAKRKISAEHLEKMRRGRQRWLENKKTEKDKSDSIIAILEEEEQEEDEEELHKPQPKSKPKARPRRAKKQVNNFYYEDEEMSSDEEEVVNNYYHSSKQRRTKQAPAPATDYNEPSYEPDTEPTPSYNNIIFR